MNTAAARLLTALCGAATLLAQDADTVRIESLPGPLLQFERGTGRTCALRIVDALTGRPLPGATLHAVRERPHPSGGDLWFDAKWQTDADGFVRFPAAEVPERCWFLVTADGYGPLANMTSPPTQDSCIIELMPGIDWPIEVRDLFDRPLADIELGLCLGCGHTPDVCVATTDHDGVAVLRCVEPTGWGDSNIRDLYPRGAGVSPEYHGHSWQLGDPPTRLHLGASRSVRGHLRAPNGQPLPGVALRSDHGQHRGPWAITDANGAFGPIAAVEALTLHFDELQYEVRLPAVADTLELTLPSAPLPDGQPKAHVAVVVQDEQGRALPGAHVTLWHVGVLSADPAEIVSDTTDESGLLVADVVAGHLGLRVEPWSEASTTYPPLFDPHSRDLEVGLDQSERVVVRLKARQQLLVRPGGDVEQVTLFTRHDDWSIELEPGIPRDIAVPRDEVFALRTGYSERDTSTRWFSFSAPPADAVVLADLPPTPVRLRVVDERGAPVAAQAWLLTRDGGEQHEAPPHAHTTDEGGVTLSTTMVGCAFLRVVPDGPGPRARDVHLALPRRGEGPLDLGDVVLPTAPQLRVLYADGSPVNGTCVVLRPGLQAHGQLAADGGWDGMTLRAGDRVEAWRDVERPNHDGSGDDTETLTATLRTQLTGDGPWTLRAGSARLRIAIVDDHGLLPRECVVLLGAQSQRLRHQTIELRDLPAGECEVFVGAMSCDSARVRVRLQEGEQRRVEVVLRRTF